MHYKKYHLRLSIHSFSSLEKERRVHLEKIIICLELIFHATYLKVINTAEDFKPSNFKCRNAVCKFVFMIHPETK